MDIFNILLLITAGINICLAIFILLKDYRPRANLFFVLLVMGLAAWSFGIAMYRSQSVEVSALPWLKFYFFSGICIGIFFYYFAHSYPFTSKKERAFMTVFHISLCVLALLICLEGKSFIEEYISRDRVVLNQTRHLFFIAYFIYFSGRGFYELWMKSLAFEGYLRRQIRVVFLATLIAGVFGITFDVILPEFTYAYIYVGPYFTVIMAFIIFYYMFIKPESR